MTLVRRLVGVSCKQGVQAKISLEFLLFYQFQYSGSYKAVCSLCNDRVRGSLRSMEDLTLSSKINTLGFIQ